MMISHSIRSLLNSFSVVWPRPDLWIFSIYDHFTARNVASRRHRWRIGWTHGFIRASRWLSRSSTKARWWCHCICQKPVVSTGQAIECKLKHWSNFRSILLGNKYISPKCPQDFLVAILVLLVAYADTLRIVAGDFNHSDFSASVPFGLVNNDFSHQNERLAWYFPCKQPSCFFVSCRPLIDAFYHAIIKVLFRIYSHSTHWHFAQCRDQKIRKRYLFRKHHDAEPDVL